jgi:hypothetical protein
VGGRRCYCCRCCWGGGAAGAVAAGVAAAAGAATTPAPAIAAPLVRLPSLSPLVVRCCCALALLLVVGFVRSLLKVRECEAQEEVCWVLVGLLVRSNGGCGAARS